MSLPYLTPPSPPAPDCVDLTSRPGTAPAAREFYPTFHKAPLKGWLPHVYDEGGLLRIRTSSHRDRSVPLHDDCVDGRDYKSERELAAEGIADPFLPCGGLSHTLTSRRSRAEVGCSLPMEV